MATGPSLSADLLSPFGNGLLEQAQESIASAVIPGEKAEDITPAQRYDEYLTTSVPNGKTDDLVDLLRQAAAKEQKTNDVPTNNFNKDTVSNPANKTFIARVIEAIRNFFRRFRKKK